MKLNAFLLLLFLIFPSTMFSQTIPTTINYQGVLNDASGNVVQNGDYNITFKLYDAESGGDALWTETKLITVTGGIINTQLGSMNEINLPFDVQYWLGITIGTDTEFPQRLKLASVPYSIMTSNIKDASISTIKLKDGAVTTGKIGDNAVTTQKVADGTLTASDIGNDQVVKKINGIRDSVNFVAGTNVTIVPSGNNLTINSTAAGEGTITGVTAGEGLEGGGTSGTVTLSVKNSGITSSMLADNAVTTAKILNGTLTAADIGNNQVIKKINGIRDSLVLAAGSNISIIPSGNTLTISSSGGTGGGDITSVIAGEGLTGGGITGDVTLSVNTSGITNTMLQSNSVTNTKIADATILTADLADNSVTSVKIADATITAGDLATGSVASDEIADGSVTSTDILNSTITSADIAGAQVVKSINTLKDDIILVAGTNVTITPSGNNLTISSAASGMGGSGTANYLPKFTGTSAIGNSVIYETGGNIGIGTTGPAPGVKLHVNGDANIYGHTLGRGNGSITSNVVFGNSALISNTSGSHNTSIGASTLSNNTTGYSNISIGYLSMSANVSGSQNIAIGNFALYSNTGDKNLVIGYEGLRNNIGNIRTTAIGYQVMKFADNRVVGRETFNTAVGYQALYGGYSTDPVNNTGQYNTAVGDRSIFSLGSGNSNTAVGYNSLYTNAIGNSNVAVGLNSLYNNSGGDNNTGLGAGSGYNNQHGSNNTAIGRYSLYNNVQSNNTAVGYSSGDFQYTLNNTTFIGYGSYPSVDNLSNTTGLGYNTRPTASNQVRIGNSSVTSIGGYAGWTNLSDGRYKLDVQENVKGLDFILKLRPVTYTLDMNKLSSDLKEAQARDENGDLVNKANQSDIQAINEKSQITYTGFVGQEVEQAARETGFNFSGVDSPKNENDFYGLRYAEFVVPLVKAVQEQQEIIEQLTKRIEELERNR